MNFLIFHCPLWPGQKITQLKVNLFKGVVTGDFSNLKGVHENSWSKVNVQMLARRIFLRKKSAATLELVK